MRELLKKILATGWLDHKLSCEVEDARYWRWGMSKERELLGRSIELIDQYWDDSKVGYPRDADNRKLFYEIQELLAQPEQEPVAYLHEGIDETGETVRRIYCHFYEHANLIPLYTAPPKREPLTSKLISLGNNCHESFIKGVRFAEKMHGIGVDDE